MVNDGNMNCTYSYQVQANSPQVATGADFLQIEVNEHFFFH